MWAASVAIWIHVVSGIASVYKLSSQPTTYLGAPIPLYRDTSELHVAWHDVTIFAGWRFVLAEAVLSIAICLASFALPKIDAVYEKLRIHPSTAALAIFSPALLLPPVWYNAGIISVLAIVATCSLTVVETCLVLSVMHDYKWDLHTARSVWLRVIPLVLLIGVFCIAAPVDTMQLINSKIPSDIPDGSARVAAVVFLAILSAGFPLMTAVPFRHAVWVPASLVVHAVVVFCVRLSLMNVD